MKVIKSDKFYYVNIFRKNSVTLSDTEGYDEFHFDCKYFEILYTRI